MPRERIVRALAGAFACANEWTLRSLGAMAVISLGEKPKWLRSVVSKTLRAFEDEPRPSFEALVRFLGQNRAVARRVGSERIVVRRWLLPSPTMGERRWPVRELDTPGDLARWLDLSASELDWFADRRGLERIAAVRPLRHYEYRWVAKPSGGFRLLEAPKARTKAIQTKILAEILSAIPPHTSVHGFCKGRDVRSHVAPHVGKYVVLKLDLSDFFLSVSAARVKAIFGAAGYPTEVARVLAELCTNRAPHAVDSPLSPFASGWEIEQRFRARRLAVSRHLPQGAPTSPALANLCAYRLDVRLAAAARSIGATYTRYADDLVFSGDREVARRASSFAALASGIALDEGFLVNYRKTRRMTQGQRQFVTGLVVNRRATVPRDDYARLEATLYNCARTGPERQNRDSHPDFHAHLRGRIGWVATVDPARAVWLEELFSRIVWPTGGGSSTPNEPIGSDRPSQ